MIDQAEQLRTLVRGNPPVQALRSEARHDAGAQRAMVIAVTSGKGGVGKTNVALMLAIALANLRKKVLLFDADLGLANVHILLGMAPRRTLQQAVDGVCAIDEIVCEGPCGIGIIPGASGITAMANIDALHLELLRRHLASLEYAYDIIIVDTSAGIGSITTEFAVHADTSLCVMTPEPTSLADGYAMLKVLSESGTARLEVVVNMAVSDDDGQEAFGRLKALCDRFLKRGVTLAGILPSDRQVPRLIRQQRVILLEQPKNPFSIRIAALARKLAGLPCAKKEGFFARVFRKEQGVQK